MNSNALYFKENQSPYEKAKLNFNKILEICGECDEIEMMIINTPYSQQ